MTEIPHGDAIVTIDGKRYNRVMAEEMARDIEIAHAIRPGVWAITPNTSLVIGNVAMLSFCDPIEHGYLVDVLLVPQHLAHLVELYGNPGGFKNEPNLHYLKLPLEEQRQNIEALRPAHEPLVKKYSEGFHTKSRLWQRHSIALAKILERISGQAVPFPEYARKLQHGTTTESNHVLPQLSKFDVGLLRHVADDIEQAHRVNPNSWSFYQVHTGGFVLIVEAVTVARLQERRGGLMLLGDPTDTQFQSIAPSVRMERYKSFAGFWVEPVSTANLENLWGDFAEVHAAGVKELASRVVTVTQRATEHQPDTLDALSILVGRELPRPAYENRHDSLTNALAGGIDRVSRPNTLTTIRDHFAASGLHYTDAQVATFYTALQTKGFVVLSGISGTGKSKIATGFVEMLPSRAVAAPIAPETAGMIAITVKPYMRTYKRVILPARQVDLLPPLPIGHQVELPISFDGLVGEGRLEHRAHTGGSSITVLYFKGEVGSAVANMALDTRLYLRPILSDEAELVTGFEILHWADLRVPLPPVDDRIVIQIKPDMQKNHRVQFFGQNRSRFPRPHERRSVDVAMHVGATSGTALLRYDGDSGRKAITVMPHQSLRKAMEALTLNESLVVDLGFNNSHDEISTIRFSSLGDAHDTRNHPVSNHLFLSVRPDWRDSTSLLGYYNPLTQTYEWTDFLHFVIRAGENYRGPVEDRIAWFVILDEMNLAHVEYYFADLLSVLESGRDADGWTSEPLRMTYPDTLDDEAPPRELKLPPNLYVIGTVNMDETTHAFSPKVLDRAFTIELTDVDFASYQITGGSNGAGDLTDDHKRALLATFSRDGRFVRIDKDEIAAVDERRPTFRSHLRALNGLLQQNRMHFGYRVFDEIGQYLFSNDENGMMTFEDAFDQAVFMKVLPKFTGSLARLQSPLHKVLAWAIAPGQVTQDDVAAVVQRFNEYQRGTATEAWVGTPAFPRVAARVRDMLVALETDGFVSFG